MQPDGIARGKEHDIPCAALLVVQERMEHTV